MTVASDLVPFAVFLAVVVVVWGFLALMLPPVWKALLQGGRAAARAMLESPRFSRWFGTRRERLQSKAPYLPVVLIVLIGAILTFTLGDMFLDLAESMRADTPKLVEFDHFVHDLAVRHRSSAETIFFVTAANVGGPAGVAVIVVITSVVLVLKKRYRWLGYLWVTAGGGALLNLALKSYFHRQRPDLAEQLRHAHGSSFPSGHAMGSMIVFSALAYIAFRAFPSWKARSLCLGIAVTAIAAVGASRIYLGVHWVSDVGAGFVAGALWTASCTAAYELFRQLYHLRDARKRMAEARSPESGVRSAE